MESFDFGEIEVIAFSGTSLIGCCNTYVLLMRGAARCIVVDPGLNIIPNFLRIQQELGRPLQIDAIWPTHAHCDHICGLRRLRRNFEGKVVCHEGMSQRIRKSPRFMEGWKATEPWSLKWLVALGAWAVGFYLGLKPDQTVEDRQLKGWPLTVESYQGHTACDAVLIDEERRFAVTGDLIFCSKGGWGWGRYDLPGGNFDLLIGSIKKLIGPSLPASATIFPGHFEPFTVAHLLEMIEITLPS